MGKTPKIVEQDNCEKCGQSIFGRITFSDGSTEDKYPSLPLRVRLGPNGIDYICPVCGKVGRAKTFWNSQSPAAAWINFIPNVSDNPLKLSAVGLDAAKAKFEPKTESLVSIAKAFHENISRLVALGDVVFLVSGLHWLEMSSYQEAELAKGEGITQKLIEVSVDHANLYRNLSKEKRQRAFTTGSTRVTVWAHYHDEVKNGMESIFSSQIVATWTAIETLLGDLWEAALNSHPGGLSELKGAPKRAQKLTSQKVSEAEKGKIWSIPLAEINRVSRGTYDLSSGMGAVLRDTFNFTRLEGAREAYSCAFHENYANVDSAICDTSIDAINIARNVLVHRAGKVDQEYVARSRKITTLPQMSVSEQFPLTAEVSNKLIAPAVASCIKLIQAVDNWIISH